MAEVRITSKDLENMLREQILLVVSWWVAIGQPSGRCYFV